MNRNDFEKWIPIDDLAPFYHMIWLKCVDGLTFQLSSTCDAQELIVHFPNYLSYMDTSELYEEGFWISLAHGDKPWSFYKSDTSKYIDFLSEESVWFRETTSNSIHYVFVTDTILHVVSDIAPIITKKYSDDNLHTDITNELLDCKSISAFIWLVDKGSELSFTYHNTQCIVSKFNSSAKVSLWTDGHEQGFETVEAMCAHATISDVFFKDAWKYIDIDEVCCPQ